MSNHGPKPFEGFEPARDEQENLVKKAARADAMRALLDTTGFVGATGLYPKGQMTKDDEGAIQFMVKSEGEKVVVDFGTQVHWLAMEPQQAAELASSLMKWARLVARKKGETVVLNLNAT